MARGRMISRSLFGSRKFRGLSQDAALLYIAMVVNAGSRGRLPADDDELADILMAAGRHWGMLEDNRLEHARDDLREAGLIEAFRDEDGGLCAEIVDFALHNKVREDREGPDIPRPEDSGSTPASSPEDSRPREEKRKEEKGGESRARARSEDRAGDPPPARTNAPPVRIVRDGDPEAVDVYWEAERIRRICRTLRKDLGAKTLPTAREAQEAAGREFSATLGDDALAAEISRVWRAKAARDGSQPRWGWVLNDLGEEAAEKPRQGPAGPAYENGLDPAAHREELDAIARERESGARPDFAAMRREAGLDANDSQEGL